jgi:AcrR family transcriptional regulator
LPKVTDEYRDARRTHILDAARRCFLREGFHETSMQDLFDEAGLSAGAVYGYFKSKEDIVLAIAEDSLGGMIATIHAFAASSHGEGLGNAFGNALELLGRRHAEDQLGAIAVLGWSEALRNPDLAHRARRLLRPMRNDLTELVRGHQETGELPKDTEPEALAAVLMSIVSGFMLQLALFDGPTNGTLPEAVRALWP